MNLPLIATLRLHRLPHRLRIDQPGSKRGWWVIKVRKMPSGAGKTILRYISTIGDHTASLSIAEGGH